jgi:hypothetical protein
MSTTWKMNSDEQKQDDVVSEEQGMAPIDLLEESSIRERYIYTPCDVTQVEVKSAPSSSSRYFATDTQFLHSTYLGETPVLNSNWMNTPAGRKTLGKFKPSDSKSQPPVGNDDSKADEKENKDNENNTSEEAVIPQHLPPGANFSIPLSWAPDKKSKEGSRDARDDDDDGGDAKHSTKSGDRGGGSKDGDSERSDRDDDAKDRGSK